MRDLILTLMLLIAHVCNAVAQEPEASDTVKFIDNAEKVIISRTDDTTLIEVETKSKHDGEFFTYSVIVEEPNLTETDQSFDFEIPFGIGKDKTNRHYHSRIKTSIFGIGHLYIGQRFNYSGKGNIKNSIEGGIRDVIGIKWSRGQYSPSFSIGLGIGFQKYRAQDGFAYSKFGSNLVLLPVEYGYYVKSTGLSVLNFQVPLIFTIPMGCDLKFTIGGIGCLNTFARAYTEISNGTTTIKTTYKGLQQRLFTAEVMCTLGLFDILGVYASWSPMTLFQSHYGPQFKSWSIGGTINF